MGAQGAAANFRWSHRADRDSLTFASPLGSTLAQLEGTATGVRSTCPTGARSKPRDWEALTCARSARPFPCAASLTGCGRCASGERTAMRARRVGRASLLRQDGWEIVYAYARRVARPLRLQLSYVDTELRLVIDDWDDAR